MTQLRMMQTDGMRLSRPPVWAVVLAFLAVLLGLGALSARQPEIGLLVAIGLPLGAGLVAWPEVTLGLYANAGLFKADPRLHGLSSLADMTLALGAVLAATLGYRLLLRRERIAWNREMGLALVFAGIIVFGVLYTPAHAYGIDKALRFTSLTLLAFFTPLVVLTSYRAVWRFFAGWVGVAALLTIEALSRLGTGQRLSGFNATTIATGRTVGIAVIVLLFAVVVGRVSRLWQILAAGGLVLMILVLAGSGARGPLLSLLGTVAVTVGIAASRPGHRMRLLLITGILAIAVFGIFSSGLIPDSALQRFDLLFNSQAGADASSLARLTVMKLAWQLFTTSPVVGHGTGSVSAFGAGQEQVYPHNILLELAAETGLLGMAVYLGLLAMVLWRLLSRLSLESDRGALWLTLLAMLLFTLSNAMVSGDINDNRHLWLFMGIVIAATGIETEAPA